MKKNTIRLTELQLNRVIKESVNNVLKESSFDDIRNSGWQDKLQQIHNIAKEMYELAKDEEPNGFGARELLQSTVEILKITERWGCNRRK